MAMRVNKNSLRALPVILLLESLTSVGAVIGVIIAALIRPFIGALLANSLLLLTGGVYLVIWMFGSVSVYGIMDLSRDFKYSWYLHITWLILKTVVLVVDGISMFMDQGMDTGTANVFRIVSEVLSAVQQFTGMAAIAFAMMGLFKVLQKKGEHALGAGCRKFVYFYMIVGILLALTDFVDLLLKSIFPGFVSEYSVGYLPVVIVYAIIQIALFLASVPAFFTAGRSCRRIYFMLQGIQEI